MSGQPINKTWENQHTKLVRSTFKQGFVSAVHPNTKTVDVSFAENPLTVVRNVPIANNVDITKLSKGQRCRVDIFDETNPSNCVLAYTY